MQVVRAELEAAKLQVSTLKAELVMSCEAADSARAASDSLAQRMRTSADTELLKVVQKVETAETELDHLRGMLANTEADAKSEAAKLQVLLEKSQANVVSAEQGVKRLEQQLAGSQTAAAQQQEELKKLHQTELKSQVQAACISMPTLLMRLPPPPPKNLPLPPPQPPPPPLPQNLSPPPNPHLLELLLTLLHTLISLAIETIVLASPAQVWM